LKKVPISCPETSATKYKLTLRNIQKKRRAYLQSGERLKLHAQKLRYLVILSVEEKWLTNPKKMNDGPSLVRFMNQRNPVHSLPFYFLAKPFNFIFPSMPRSPEQWFCFAISYEKAVCPFPSTCATRSNKTGIRHTTGPSA
jgi:hypothetical protein